MKLSAPLFFLVRHGWALMILLLLALIAASASAPGANQVDSAVGTEAQHAAAMVKQQQKVERAEQLAELTR